MKCKRCGVEYKHKSGSYCGACTQGPLFAKKSQQKEKCIHDEWNMCVLPWGQCARCGKQVSEYVYELFSECFALLEEAEREHIKNGIAPWSLRHKDIKNELSRLVKK